MAELDDTTPDTPSTMNGMRASVRSIFPSFTDKFEGRVPYLYTDVFGLVTTGRGNLVDYGYRRHMVAGQMGPMGASSPDPALALGWHRSGADPSRPSDDEISEEWWKVKRAWPQRQSVACEFLTHIRLYSSDIDALTFSKLDEMWSALRKRFPGLEDWPACAQLGVCSMSWAMGSNFQFPKFVSAVLGRDWSTAANECAMNATGNSGLIARNAANRRLFLGALTDMDVADAV